MAGTTITDMRDFFLENPQRELAPAAARLQDFLGGIVQAGTANLRRQFVSGIACRRRPGNRRCSGSIDILKADLPERSIIWKCAVCGDNGRISGFQGCVYDLSAVSETSGRSGQKRSVLLSLEEYRSWISGDMITYDQESAQTIYAAVADEHGVVVSVPEDELDYFYDCMAADANHELNKKRRAHLESIYDKLEAAGKKSKRRHSPPTRQRRLRNDVRRPTADIDSAYAHGFFSALVAGPTVMPTHWLPRFLSEPSATIEEVQARAQRVMNAYNDVADMLFRHRERFGEAMLAIANRDPRGDALIDWHRGFLEAMEFNPDEWMALLSKQGKDIFQPMALISQCSEDPSKRDWLADPQLRENVGGSLAVMTARLWETYRDEPLVPVELGDRTQRRLEPKASRNEPCPCGSGKKYKRCCGSTLRAL